MQALFTLFVSTALLCSAVCADDWPPNRQANSATQRTAPQFKPAPPRPLRGNAASVRAAGYDDDFDPRGVQRAQFSGDNPSGNSNRDNADPSRFSPPRNSQLEAQRSGSGTTADSAGVDLKFDKGDEFARSQGGYTRPAPTNHGDESSFSTGSPRYVPPTDLGPTSGTPNITAPPLTTPSTPTTRIGPPPAAVPQRSLPPTVAPRQPSRAARDTFGSNSNYNYGSTNSFPDDRNRTLGAPPPPTTRTTTTPPASTLTTPRYDDRYRQAQVTTPASTEDRGMIVPPPSYPRDDPIEKAASAAANTVERGALSVSNAIKNSAEHISEEGRRRGNSYFLTLLALFASVGLNLYLGWIAWDTYNRYQDLVADMRYTGPRRSSTSETDSSYGDSSLAEAAAY